MTDEYDSTDKQQVKRAKSISRGLNSKMQRGIGAILNNPDACYALSCFLSESSALSDFKFNAFASSFDYTPHVHAYKEGYKHAGNWWLNKIMLHKPEELHKLQKAKEFNKEN